MSTIKGGPHPSSSSSSDDSSGSCHDSDITGSSAMSASSSEGIDSENDLMLGGRESNPRVILKGAASSSSSSSDSGSYTGSSVTDTSSTNSSVIKNPVYSVFYEFLVDRHSGGQTNVTDALIRINESIQDLTIAIDARNKKSKKKKKVV